MAPGGLRGGPGGTPGDVMGCRNSKVLPEPPGDVQLDLVKKVGKGQVDVRLCLVLISQYLTCRRLESF